MHVARFVVWQSSFAPLSRAKCRALRRCGQLVGRSIPPCRRFASTHPKQNTESTSAKRADTTSVTVEPLKRSVPSLSELGGEGTLDLLRDRSGYLPRPVALPEEEVKTGFRSGRSLFVFFLCNAIPFGGLLYYLQDQRAQRAEMSLHFLPLTGNDVAAEAMRVIRTSPSCFLLQQGDVGSTPLSLRVDPHSPEGEAYVPPEGPLEWFPSVERSDLTDIFECPPVPGLRFISLAVSRSSEAGRVILKGNRVGTLLYSSSTRGACCTVGGQLSILADPESRRHYWKNWWVSSFPPPPAEKIQAIPSATIQKIDDTEAPRPWENSEYLLLRLNINEITLQAMVDGPQRWQNRRVQRTVVSGDNDERHDEWVLAAPMV